MKPTMVLVFVAIAPAWAANVPAPALSRLPAVLQQEANKAVARRVFDEIFNQGRFDAASEIYAPDFVNHGLHRDVNLAEDQAAARWEKEIAPDLHMSVVLMVAEGDLVSVVWIARGTNTRAAGWLPATGTKIELRGMTTWRIVNGRIREEWSSFDLLRVVRQFLDQLKWVLLGALCVLLLVAWAAFRMVRRMFPRRAVLRA